MTVKEYSYLYISSNLDSIYIKTKSKDLNKYYKLIILISKKRVETGFKTNTQWKDKMIKVSKKKLTRTQIEAHQWILDHREEVRNYIRILLNRRN